MLELKTGIKNRCQFLDLDSFIILVLIPSILISLGFILDSPKNIILGLYKIIISSDILLVDYVTVGGLSATLINVGLLIFFSSLIVFLLKLKLNGPLLAGILTIGGFGFMGKNILNIWPMFLGGFLYSLYKDIKMNTIMVPLLFITTLAPVVTFFASSLGLSWFISIPLAIIIGILIGFVVAPMANQMIKFHDGYNLYNIGFTGGILGTIIAACIKAFGIPLETQSILSVEYSGILRNLMIGISLLFMTIGFIRNEYSFKNYRKILEFPGTLITDFPGLVGFPNTYINMGIMGLISTFYVILIQGTFNGPVLAGILTVIAFSAFGKHPKNSIPIIIGVFLAGKFTVYELSSTSIVIAALFGTTLAPIAGEFGWIPGIFAGFFHVAMVTNVLVVHGGLNLYNNGFSGGIVAAIMVPILRALLNRESN